MALKDLDQAARTTGVRRLLTALTGTGGARRAGNRAISGRAPLTSIARAALLLAGAAGWTMAASAQTAPSTAEKPATTLTVAPPEVAASIGDPLFARPYIDQDEERLTPVPHRYVHGGFRGTDTRFSFYFPPKAQYQGRFYQYFAPQAGPENTAAGGKGPDTTLGFAAASGGYFVETNLGGLGNLDDATVRGFRASAAAANYSRVLARQIYGGKRPYGYAYGGSGGGFRTMASAENATAWDGIVPFVIGSPMHMPYVFTARVRALRILKDKWPQIVDAIEPGGSGDMYAGLTPEEAAALREITRFGFPQEGWAGYKTLGGGALAVLYPGVRSGNPEYFADFWTKPGYAGSDPASSQSRARVQLRTRVTRLLTAEDLKARGIPAGPDMSALMGMGGNNAGNTRKDGRPTVGGASPFGSNAMGAPPLPKRPAAEDVGQDVATVDFRASTAGNQALQNAAKPAPARKRRDGPSIVAIEVEQAPGASAYLENADLIVRSGAMAGKVLPLGVVTGNVVNPNGGFAALIAKFMGGASAGGEDNDEILASLAVGDEVQIDNSDYLAVEDFARHQVPDASFYTWDQYRDAQGKPLYPQQARLHGPEASRSATGTVQSGLFNGKMIVVETLADTEAYPWAADWYARLVRQKDPARFRNNFRLWFVEHANHGGPNSARAVSYQPVLNQALRDVAAWAERGVAPPASTAYRVEDGHILVPDAAAQRKGIQPVVALKANGGDRVEIAAGQSVTFSGTIELPAGTGRIIRAEWDFEGTGSFPDAAVLTPVSATRATVTATHSYARPGTYFAVLRGASHRTGDTETNVGVIFNIDRVRVVVK